MVSEHVPHRPLEFWCVRVRKPSSLPGIHTRNNLSGGCGLRMAKYYRGHCYSASCSRRVEGSGTKRASTRQSWSKRCFFKANLAALRFEDVCSVRSLASANSSLDASATRLQRVSTASKCACSCGGKGCQELLFCRAIHDIHMVTYGKCQNLVRNSFCLCDCFLGTDRHHAQQLFIQRYPVTEERHQRQFFA
jgi:hypothetical protein